MAYGTLSLADLLATTDAAAGLTVIKFGEDRIFEVFDVELALHREQLAEKMGLLVDISTDRLRRYGAGASVNLDPMDEFGSPDAQKIAPAGTTVGFPLRRYGIAEQWTRDWFTYHTARELAIQFTARVDADVRRIDGEVRRALFTPVNYTFVDALSDQVDLPVKALVNADGAAIPNGPGGITFNGATHTHYLGTGSLVAADITALITTVIEHYNTGAVMLYINKAQEAAVRAMTSNFTPYTDPRLIQPNSVVQARGSLDILNPNDRALGLFNEAEVWVKPWIPANYMFAYMRGAPQPLVLRNPQLGESGLHLAYDNESYPLRAQAVKHDFGVGVWNRTNGAVLLTNNATYAAPTITI